MTENLNTIVQFVEFMFSVPEHREQREFRETNLSHALLFIDWPTFNLNREFERALKEKGIRLEYRVDEYCEGPQVVDAWCLKEVNGRLIRRYIGQDVFV